MFAKVNLLIVGSLLYALIGVLLVVVVRATGNGPTDRQEMHLERIESALKDKFAEFDGFSSGGGELFAQITLQFISQSLDWLINPSQGQRTDEIAISQLLDYKYREDLIDLLDQLASFGSNNDADDDGCQEWRFHLLGRLQWGVASFKPARRHYLGAFLEHSAQKLANKCSLEMAKELNEFFERDCQTLDELINKTLDSGELDRAQVVSFTSFNEAQLEDLRKRELVAPNFDKEESKPECHDGNKLKIRPSKQATCPLEVGGSLGEFCVQFTRASNSNLPVLLREAIRSEVDQQPAPVWIAKALTFLHGQSRKWIALLKVCKLLIV